MRAHAIPAMTQPWSSILLIDSRVEVEPEVVLEPESDLVVENEMAKGRRLPDPGRKPKERSA